MCIRDRYPVVWNDLLAQAQFAGGFVPTATPDVVAAGTFMRPTPAVTPNFAQEIVSLPLSVQQSILSLINGSTAAAAPPPQPQHFSPLAGVDPSWLLQQKASDGAALVSTPLGPSIVTVPVVSKATMLPGWPGSFVATPGAIPVFTSAEWPGVRIHPHVVSQPSTPISHHVHHYTAGQKRKLLPSPEKSPEGNYIGQHSQGIGGHYADSYFKKKRMF